MPVMKFQISTTKDINEDISNGSNHTGKDTDKYFTFNKDMKTGTKTGIYINRTTKKVFPLTYLN